MGNETVELRRETVETLRDFMADVHSGYAAARAHNNLNADLAREPAAREVTTARAPGLLNPKSYGSGNATSGASVTEAGVPEQEADTEPTPRRGCDATNCGYWPPYPLGKPCGRCDNQSEWQPRTSAAPDPPEPDEDAGECPYWLEPDSTNSRCLMLEESMGPHSWCVFDLDDEGRESCPYRALAAERDALREREVEQADDRTICGECAYARPVMVCTKSYYQHPVAADLVACDHWQPRESEPDEEAADED